METECPSGKVAYANGQEAGKAKMGLKRRSGHAGAHTGLHVFNCPECGMWHLGRDMKVKPKRTMRRFLSPNREAWAKKRRRR